MENIYNTIAQYIFDCIEEDFELATLNIEAFDRSAGVEGNYIDKNGLQKDIDVTAAPNVNKEIMQFYQETKANPNFTKWNRAVATLTGEHGFNIKFIWDQELQDKIDSYN